MLRDIIDAAKRMPIRKQRRMHGRSHPRHTRPDVATLHSIGIAVIIIIDARKDDRDAPGDGLGDVVAVVAVLVEALADGLGAVVAREGGGGPDESAFAGADGGDEFGDVGADFVAVAAEEWADGPQSEARGGEAGEGCGDGDVRGERSGCGGGGGEEEGCC